MGACVRLTCWTNENQQWGRAKFLAVTITGLTGVFAAWCIGTKYGMSPSFTVNASEKKEKKCKKKKKDKHGGKKSKHLAEAIEKSRELCQRIKEETGSPGLTVAVSIDGNVVWSEGMGYADVENRLPCQPETIFRIASISKSITMATVAKLWETGELDLDKPVQFYVPSFPEKTFDGNKVTITTRQLVSHLAGIRHYYKDYSKYKTDNENKKELPASQSNDLKPESNQSDPLKQSSTQLKTSDQSSKGSDRPKDKTNQSETKSTTTNQPETKNNRKQKTESEDEMLLKEYYIKKKYSSVKDSLEIFKNDPLVFKPGTQFLYSSHGWTVVSAVVEGAAKLPFEKCIKKLFRDLGMDNTFLEENEPLIYNRGRHYVKNKSGRLVNAPYVDLSYKWAGGGMISNVLDLVRFGNIMLYSYQMPSTSCHGNQELPSNQEQNTVTSGEERDKVVGNRINNAGHNISDEKYDTGKDNKDQSAHVTSDNISVVDGENGKRDHVTALSADWSNKDKNNNLLAGFLKPETMKMIWEPVTNARPNKDSEGLYGMGWYVFGSQPEYGFCKEQKYFVSHTGAAVGGSSVLLILPSKEELSKKTGKLSSDSSENVLQRIPPQGVVVAIIVNMMSAGLSKTALEIARNFDKM